MEFIFGEKWNCHLKQKYHSRWQKDYVTRWKTHFDKYGLWNSWKVYSQKYGARKETQYYSIMNVNWNKISNF